jgi:acyl transferase domain-containing protein
LSTRDIAIIGMGCCFPGANDVGAFWREIAEGRSHFRKILPDRWSTRLFYDENSRAADKTYTAQMAPLDDIRSFAPAFFGITPKRARVMDPQQRLLLESTRVALEDAGYARRLLPRKTTGVYTGISVSEYRDIVTVRARAAQLLDGAFGRRAADAEAGSALVERVPPLHAYTMVGQMLNMTATNVARAFDFGGPAFSVDTACSSALVALHEAVLHLRHGITDAAIVGGVYVHVDPAMFVAFSRIGALSLRGICAPFDHRADGFVLGEGAGVVVLKRAEDARRDGDRVWALIKGVAINNDGRSEGPMTPSREGQLAVLERAYLDAGVAPQTVTLIEAHGTATAAGDTTEVGALSDFFGNSSDTRIERTLTSVKGNIGHSLAASGMASLIKTILALSYRVLPMQASFEKPRPDLNLATAGFHILNSSRAWDSRHERRAGVSSFGFGGTNAHVVLSEAEVRTSWPAAKTGDAEPEKIGNAIPFTVTAPTWPLLCDYIQQLKDTLLERSPDVTMADVGYTLGTRRLDNTGVTFTASSWGELFAALDEALESAGSSESVGRVSFHAETSEIHPDSPESENLVWLPPSPLVTREFWAVRSGSTEMEDPDPEIVLQPLGARVPPDANNSAAPCTLDATSVREAVMAAVARVSAHPVEDLLPAQALGTDLGFDSLMSAALAVELEGLFPALPADSSSLFRPTTTIEELIAQITAFTKTAGQ